MAKATSLSWKGGQNSYDSIAASQTDSVLVSASGSSRIIVTGIFINQGDTTASSVTFNSKGSGAGTAIFPSLKYAANGGTNIFNENGFFATNPGESLTVTTGAGSTTAVAVTYTVDVT